LPEIPFNLSIKITSDSEFSEV